MFSIVEIETIVNFLKYYNIDYYSLSLEYQSIVVILSNVLFLIFWFIIGYILYRLILRLFD